MDVKNEISVRLCLVLCSINSEVLPYLHHIGKLTSKLLHATSAIKQKCVFSHLVVIINI